MAAPYIDRDVEVMLCKTQPGHFDGEGTDVGRKLEEWLEKMDDYFDLAQLMPTTALPWADSN